MEADVAPMVPLVTWPALPPPSLRLTRDPTEKARTRAGSAGLTSSLRLLEFPHTRDGEGKKEQQDQCYCAVLAEHLKAGAPQSRPECLPTPTFTTFYNTHTTSSLSTLWQDLRGTRGRQRCIGLVV